MNHRDIQNYLLDNPKPLAISLGINPDDIFIKGMEFKISDSGEAVDFVFQNQYCSTYTLPDTTLYVLEIKTDRATSDIICQLNKYSKYFTNLLNIKHWHKVEKVSLAKEYPESTITELKEINCNILYYNDINDFKIFRKNPISS